jgi:hypothetical protein
VIRIIKRESSLTLNLEEAVQNHSLVLDSYNGAFFIGRIIELVRENNNRSRNSRPILRKAVPRERLFEQLDRFQGVPVIWVSGPAGSGKTTLVSSYLQDRRIPNLCTR